MRLPCGMHPYKPFFVIENVPLLQHIITMRELSVVITVMNEEENIKPLLISIRKALNGIDYEVILVDDGSSDKTKQQILEHTDDRTVLVELRKNYGQSTAMTAGIDYANAGVREKALECFNNAIALKEAAITLLLIRQTTFFNIKYLSIALITRKIKTLVNF